MREMYRNYGDNDSLMALADLDKQLDRARELSIYREQEKTQEIITAALNRFKNCVHKLTNVETAKNMSDTERAYCLAAMDWAMYTLDIVGENPERVESQVDEMIEGYARKAGIIHS